MGGGLIGDVQLGFGRLERCVVGDGDERGHERFVGGDVLPDLSSCLLKD